MKKRHIVFGAVFLAVFVVGSLNIISDGRIGHALRAQVPGHGGSPGMKPDISIDRKVTLKQGGISSATAEIRNARIVSYANPTITSAEENRIEVEADLAPPPRMVQQSLPPSWVYSHGEPEIMMDIDLNASETVDPGNYTFRVTAESSMDINASEASEQFSVTVVNGSAE